MSLAGKYEYLFRHFFVKINTKNTISWLQRPTGILRASYLYYNYTMLTKHRRKHIIT